MAYSECNTSVGNEWLSFANHTKFLFLLFKSKAVWLFHVGFSLIITTQNFVDATCSVYKSSIVNLKMSSIILLPVMKNNKVSFLYLMIMY